MKERALTATLASLLLVATILLGAAFEAGGIPGGSGSAGTHLSTTSGNQGTNPRLVVQARRVAQEYLLESAQYTQYANGSLPDIPAYMLGPISNVKFALTQDLPSASGAGRAFTYYVYTNSSGLSEGAFPGGNYTVRVSGDVFNYTGTISLEENITTYLGLTAFPTFNAVSSVKVVNQDPFALLGPASTVFMEVAGAFDPVPGAPYSLISPTPGSPIPTTVMEGVLKGEYPSPGGTWAVMSPTGTLQTVPTSGSLLMRYASESVIMYTGTSGEAHFTVSVQ